jgi:hypothetical protein
MTSDKDKITCEYIGNDTTNRDWIRDHIVYPQPGMIAPPYPQPPANNGWVRMIASYKDLEGAIKEKIKTIIPTPPPKPDGKGGSTQINQNINQNILAVSGNGRGLGSSIWLPQNGGNTANSNGQNNQIDQNINQKAEGISQNALGGKIN